MVTRGFPLLPASCTHPLQVLALSFAPFRTIRPCQGVLSRQCMELGSVVKGSTPSESCNFTEGWICILKYKMSMSCDFAAITMAKIIHDVELHYKKKYINIKLTIWNVRKDWHTLTPEGMRVYQIKRDFKIINVANMEVLNFVLGQT